MTEHRGRAQLVWKDAQGRRLTGLTHVVGATEGRGGVLEVESGSLDEYFAQERRRIRLIKVDVEGAEVGVFRGADAVLRRFRPLVYTELVNAYLERYGHTTADVFRIFKGLDYRTFRIVDGPVDHRNWRPKHYSKRECVKHDLMRRYPMGVVFA